MTPQDRITLTQELFSAFLQGDMGPIFAAVSDDVEVRLTISPGTPISGVFHGKDGLAEYFTKNAATVETTAFEILNYLAGGDQVAIVGRESLIVRSTGAANVDSDWVMLCTFKEDKIASIVVIENTAVIAEAYPTARA